jgi:hypothetical protein
MSALCGEIKDDSRLLEKKEQVRDLSKKEKCDFYEIIDFEKFFNKCIKKGKELSSIKNYRKVLGYVNKSKFHAIIIF